MPVTIRPSPNRAACIDRDSVTRRWAGVLTFVLLWSAPAAAQEKRSVPETLTIGEHTLMLNGAGMRRQMFVDVYLACLYVVDPGAAPEDLLDSDEPQAITLHMTSDLVNSARLEEATMDGLRRSTDGDLKALRDEIERLHRMFDGEVKKGDTFRLAYLPGSGVMIHHNDRYLGTIRGKRFKRALFGIWLSDRPVQKSLKKDLLDGVEDES